MKNVISVVLIALLSAACSSMQATQVDPRTGYLPSTSRATVVSSRPIDLDAHKQLIVVGGPESKPQINAEFMVGQLRNLNYFDEVISVEDLETRIIQAGLTDKVQSLRDKIGINNAARKYRPFLWLRFDTRGSGLSEYARFIITDPITLQDYFVTETHLDRLWV